MKKLRVKLNIYDTSRNAKGEISHANQQNEHLAHSLTHTQTTSFPTPTNKKKLKLKSHLS